MKTQLSTLICNGLRQFRSSRRMAFFLNTIKIYCKSLRESVFLPLDLFSDDWSGFRCKSLRESVFLWFLDDTVTSLQYSDTPKIVRIQGGSNRRNPLRNAVFFCILYSFLENRQIGLRSWSVRVPASIAWGYIFILYTPSIQQGARLDPTGSH